MDSLIALLLIGWIISAVSKKKKGKKTKKTAANTAVHNDNADQRREARIARMRQELEKRKTEMQKQAESQQLSFIPEGASAAGSGSMMFDSSEGECLCDPELEHERIAEEDPQSVYAQEIGSENRLDFSAQGLRQAIVMNEILTRPAQRFGRR